MSKPNHWLLVSLARNAGRRCEVEACSAPVRAGSVGSLCQFHERRKQRLGHPEAVPLQANEVRYWRREARWMVRRTFYRPSISLALGVCNAVLQRGPEMASEQSLRANLVRLRECQVRPGEILEIILVIGLCEWCDPGRRMRGDQLWFEAVRWTVKLKGNCRDICGPNMGARARRELAEVLRSRLGLFVKQCATEWDMNPDLHWRLTGNPWTDSMAS
jgi:hypothetical protein